MKAIKSPIRQDTHLANLERMESDTIRLSKNDSIAFVNALRYPPPANALLRELMKKQMGTN